LHSISSLSLIPTLGSNQSTKTNENGTLTAADLLISTSEVPPGFEQHQEPGSNTYIDALDKSAFDIADADIATRGYWKGPTQAEPEWVLSTMAIVTEDPPRAVIESAAQQAHDEYTAEYDAETSSLINFEQAHTTSDTTAEWQLNIHKASLFDDTTTHVYTDIMRHQYVENAVLGTVVFGPTNVNTSVDSLLDTYATLQRIRYETHGATL
jgi:hypothetical protein